MLRSSDLVFSTARTADAEFPKNRFRRAEAGEGGLQQVRSHKGGEPEPVRMHIVAEGQADEDHGTGEGADGVFEFHEDGGI